MINVNDLITPNIITRTSQSPTSYNLPHSSLIFRNIRPGKKEGIFERPRFQLIKKQLLCAQLPRNSRLVISTTTVLINDRSEL